MTRPFALPATALLALALGCGQDRSDRDPNPTPDLPSKAPPADLLATVNGVPITEADLRVRAKSSAHEQGTPGKQPDVALDPVARKNVLETIIREELMAQRAVKQGLDDDPAYREALAGLEAELGAFKRQKLGELFARHDRGRVEVSDADARRYYDENSAQLRRELKVQQILLRDQGRIEEAHRAIAAGTPFEEVAARNFPNLPADAPRPWELGFLKWTQLPEPWRPALSKLAKGQTTEILRGPRNRFWIVKLIDEREDPEATFETWRPHIVEILRGERLEARRAETERALRREARIVYAAPTKATKATKHPAPAPAPEPEQE